MSTRLKKDKKSKTAAKFDLGKSIKPRQSESSKRYARYKNVIDLAVGRSQFELDEIKTACEDEKPGFITRIVNELEKKGFIVREAGSEPKVKAYRWNQARTFSVSKWLDEKLFGSQIKESPEQERPREKLLANGADRLATSELIAILIRSGLPGESAVDGGQKVSKAYDGRLEDLPSAGRRSLRKSVPQLERWPIVRSWLESNLVAELRLCLIKKSPVGSPVAATQLSFAKIILPG